MALATIKSRQYPEHYAQASGVAKPTAGVPYGATLYETDTALWYIFTAAGWVLETMPAVAATLPAGVDVNSLPGTSETDLASMKADLDTIQADIALIKAQNQTAKLASHSFAFDEDDLTKTSAIAYNGLVKHLHLVVPNFTNVVTATVTLVDASGRIVWTSAAKAKNASYNLELDTAAVWADQLVDSTLIWTVTISGAAGGAGGTVVLVPRYYGV